MKLINIYDKESKLYLDNVVMHSSATKDDIYRAVLETVNKVGYNLNSTLNIDSFLIVEWEE